MRDPSAADDDEEYPGEAAQVAGMDVPYLA
jgi:hypothetical protein